MDKDIYHIDTLYTMDAAYVTWSVIILIIVVLIVWRILKGRKKKTGVEEIEIQSPTASVKGDQVGLDD